MASFCVQYIYESWAVDCTGAKEGATPFNSPTKRMAAMALPPPQAPAWRHLARGRDAGPDGRRERPGRQQQQQQKADGYTGIAQPERAQVCFAGEIEPSLPENRRLQCLWFFTKSRAQTTTPSTPQSTFSGRDC